MDFVSIYWMLHPWYSWSYYVLQQPWVSYLEHRHIAYKTRGGKPCWHKMKKFLISTVSLNKYSPGSGSRHWWIRPLMADGHSSAYGSLFCPARVGFSLVNSSLSTCTHGIVIEAWNQGLWSIHTRIILYCKLHGKQIFNLPLLKSKYQPTGCIFPSRLLEQCKLWFQQQCIP